ncbi:MAG: sugar porter family MFS transporter [Armatimonadota bacterium]
MEQDVLVKPEPTTPQDRQRFAYFIAFVAAIGGFLFGYDLVIISGAQIFIRDYFHLANNPRAYGFAVSCAMIGCMLGPICGAYLCDKLGRKAVLMIASLLFVVGAVGTALPRDIITFDIFRIIGGVGVGFASLASPMYIAEVAPAKKRGALGLMYQLAVCVGCTLAVIVAWIMAKTLPDSVSWRWMFASIIVPIIAFVLMIWRAPQSPRWLAEKNRSDEALDVLTKINGPEVAKEVLDEINMSLKEETGSLRELFQPGVKLALLTGILLALFNNLTGWTGVGYYLPTIFQMAGYTKASDAIGVSLIPNIAGVILTIVAIKLVDRVGRRPLWIITSAAMFFMLLLMGLVFQLQVKGPVVILMTLLILAPHSIGLGGLPWLMMSELFPTRIRAWAVSITTTVIWFAGFVGTMAVPKVVQTSERTIGSGAGVFWMFAVVCIFSFIFGVKMLPETKGRTLEDIAKNWTGNKK